MFQARHHLRHEFFGELQHALAGFARVDADLFDAVADEIAQHPQHQGQVFVQGGHAGHFVDALLNRAPQAPQELHVGPQGPGFGALRRGADDIAAAEFGAEGVDHLLQALAFAFAVDLDRDPRYVGIGQKHQKARRQGHMRGQARPFGADGVLDHLHHQVLTFVDQVGHGEAEPFAVAIGGRAVVLQDLGANVGDVQEGGPFQADIHEGCFHARQHPTDPALVDIADQAALADSLDQNFLQHAILDHGDPGFAGGDVDQNFVASAAFGTCGHTVVIPVDE